jgi:hypothetical protein
MQLRANPVRVDAHVLAVSVDPLARLLRIGSAGCNGGLAGAAGRRWARAGLVWPHRSTAPVVGGQGDGC